MGSVKTTIQIELSTKTIFEVKPKVEALKELSKLDNEALNKLVELSKIPVAVDNLKNNFEMIKGFLGN
jgi:hypothetical protein